VKLKMSKPVMTVALCSLLFSAALSHAANDITLTSSNNSPAVNATFTITINLQNAVPFTNWGQTLLFDNTKLQLTAQGAGTFSTFVPDSRSLANINTSGQVRAGGFGFSDNAGGNGTLGVFTFQAIAAGSSNVSTEAKSGADPFGDVLQPSAGGDVLPGSIGSPATESVGAPVINSTLTATGTVGQAFSYIQTRPERTIRRSF
jgi:hypothetical protein